MDAGYNAALWGGAEWVVRQLLRGDSVQGQLFTEYFLEEGIRATPEWSASVAAREEFESFREGVREKYEALSGAAEPNEAVTEQELVRPVLELLGWEDYLPQQGTAGGEEIPDHLLFVDAESKGRAVAKGKAHDRYSDALVVEESKRFGLPLDVRDPDSKNSSRTPHGQILRYLSTAESGTDGDLHWGFLTNGGVWRLYDYRKRPRATGYYEADLGPLLEAEDEDDLRTFYLLFRRQSFILRDGAVATFLDAALAEGRRYEERVAQDLSSVVFEKVFPSLAGALADASGAPLADVRHASLIFLYRLLFVLYAEDRGLLPVNDTRYDDYGLRKGVRDDVALRTRQDDAFSSVATLYYDRLTTLFKLIDRGDASIGLPPYNGGLFSEDAAPMLESVRLPDSVMAPIVYDLSHTETDGERRYVNYRDMSVQQLGSIYERLLEREPVRDEDGKIVVRPNSYARKDSGSFFTPQELVDLIIDRTLKPLADERLTAFEQRSRELRGDQRSKSKRLADLRKIDPAEAVLDLKVLDPAMGSGHFLVSAVDFLSDYVAELVENVPAVPEWVEGEYESPVVRRIAAIREDILRRASESDWVIDESLLTDQAIIRRMVLKRCIYGVDKNPLTVELAKVSLWLHSFTVGAPLSFLDHHLRCGDSLIGMRVRGGLDELNRLSGLFATSAIQGAENATAGMQLIEEMSDADVAEVRESASLFREVEATTGPMRGLLDFLCGLRWLTAGMKKKERTECESTLVEFLGRNPNDAYQLLAFGPGALGDADSEPGFEALWNDAKAVADRESFLHWEVAFPGVWHRWQDVRPRGGFDAVIGNPPWDEIEQPAPEWFPLRGDETEWPARSADRIALIERRIIDGDELAVQYDAVRQQAAKMRALVRDNGDFPLLSGGRINLYSLFVERAMGLVKPDGFVGLLTPSGIYSDEPAAEFFKYVSTNGRVSNLFDFENKGIFFKDVHRSLRFCVLIIGGEERLFVETECAFFLHDTESVNDQERCIILTPSDFARVNPNTGTAPVFQIRRDADITRSIYERHPVLVKHSGRQEKKAWPIRHKRGMFNLTTDSRLFREAEQLKELGFYPVDGNKWRKGEELYLTHYQGRMIHQFDHRWNSVGINPQSAKNPYTNIKVTQDQYTDPNFFPSPYFWVPAHEVEATVPESRGWSLGFRDVARTTDVRTMIASVLPWVGSDLAIRLILPTEAETSAEVSGLLLANFNSFVFDYIVRQKVQGTHVSWYIVEQLPVIAPEDYDRRFGEMTARELVRDHVLRLTYTAHDMEPFARDLGYDGPPFRWDEESRRHLRARLDALYFHLYGLGRDDADYVLGTFPIVKREDEKAFGSYRTRDMILAYMSALDAGDTETVVSV